MRFKLKEQTLTEVTDPIEDLYHIYQDLTANSYNAHGYFSSMSNAERDALLKYCKAAKLDFDDIKQNWNAHHINGIHPTSKNNINGNYKNIALVTKKAHKVFTEANRGIIDDLAEKLLYTGDSDIDSLIGRIIAKCLAKKIKISSILKGTRYVTKLIKEVPNKAAAYFHANWKELNVDKINVIPMEFLMSGDLMKDLHKNIDNNAEDNIN